VEKHRERDEAEERLRVTGEALRQHFAPELLPAPRKSPAELSLVLAARFARSDLVESRLDETEHLVLVVPALHVTLSNSQRARVEQAEEATRPDRRPAARSRASGFPIR